MNCCDFILVASHVCVAKKTPTKQQIPKPKTTITDLTTQKGAAHEGEQAGSAARLHEFSCYKNTHFFLNITWIICQSSYCMIQVKCY